MQQAPKPPLEKQGRAGARRKAKKARKSPGEDELLPISWTEKSVTD